jgi:uncharacterized alpha-E superfamily protein
MIFDTRLPRSIAFCTGEIQRMVGKLRGEFRLRSAQRVYDHVERFQKDLQERGRNEKLLDELHCFNDWVQRELMELTAELGTGLFGHQAEKETETEAPEIPAPPKPGLGSSGQTQSQSSAQTQTQG